jgi:hypothetical protein
MQLNGKQKFLSAEYYQKATANPIEIQQFTNIGQFKATELFPVLT